MFCFTLFCSTVCRSEYNEAVAECNEESQNCKEILPVGQNDKEKPACQINIQLGLSR